ncbi:hypothetical protein BC826DRAFT_1112241 [Russula brevipes]|nr:hypothetical protein BC826DRAFT_1112241 [Russula brevipes]
MLPISNIEFLSISSPDMVQSVNWGELFQRCTKLTPIEATGRGTSGLLKELTPPEPRKAPSDGEGRQKKLDNRGVPAPASSSTADTPEYGLWRTPVRRPLDHAPMAKGVQSPLRVLRIDNCSITTDCTNALGKLVPEFLWNEHKGAPLDEFDEFDDLSDVGTEDQLGD